MVVRSNSLTPRSLGGGLLLGVCGWLAYQWYGWCVLMMALTTTDATLPSPAQHAIAPPASLLSLAEVHYPPPPPSEPVAASFVRADDILARMAEGDTTLDIQIAWANGTGKDALLQRLYQCRVLQLAAVVGQQLHLLTPAMPWTPSQWGRRVQGELSAQETRWWQHAAPGAQAVRVVPYALDQALATHLAQAVRQQASSAIRLRGHYDIASNRLWLANIHLNGVPIEGSWPLLTLPC